MIEQALDMVSFANPLRVYLRRDSLVIQDYRPTWIMALSLGGFIVMSLFSYLVLASLGSDGIAGMILCGVLALVCLFIAATQSIREVYYFHLPTDSYRFERQYVLRKEVIEGALDQFTGAHVETVDHGDGVVSYRVVLRQEGLFLTGADEQTLRTEAPLLNFFSSETRIARAISVLLSKGRQRRARKKP